MRKPRKSVRSSAIISDNQQDSQMSLTLVLQTHGHQGPSKTLSDSSGTWTVPVETASHT
jgi:hypothetical protein